MRKISLLFSDFLAFYGALALVLLARYGASQWSNQWNVHVAPFSILLVVWIFALYIANLYEQRTMRNDRAFFERLTQAMTVATIASIIFFYLIPTFGIAPKLNLFLFLITLAALMWGIRLGYNRLLASGSKKNILVVGHNQESLELVQFISENPQFGYRVAGILRIGQHELPLDERPISCPIIESLQDAPAFIDTEDIALVVISPSAYAMREVVDLFFGTLSQRVDFTKLATFTETLTGTVPLGAIDQTWFLDNISQHSRRAFNIIKRATDITAVIVLGIPTLAILPFIALAIYVESPGPIFFTNRRTGRGGKPFDMLKFRSMRPDAERATGAVWASQNDPRVTRVGKFLRTTRIDELPQLVNILRGEMSLVGPRAERPEFDSQLATQIPFYRERYLIKPGLSGWAQINYPYGSSVQDAEHKLEYDLYYIKHRSLVLDIEIILKTINISIRRAGR